MLQKADISLTLLNVGLAKHHGDWNWQNVRSPFARIYYVTEGSARVVLSDTTLTLQPGRLYLIPPYVTHHCECSGVFTHYYIHLYEQHETDQQGIFDEQEMPHEVDAHPSDRMLFERLCQLMPQQALHASNPESYDNHATLMDTLRESQQRHLGVRIEAKGIMQILLSRFVSQSQPRITSQDDRIAKILSYISQHISEKTNLDNMAEEMCLSKDHMIRIFRQSTGETPGTYITRKKIEQAELLLITTDIPVKNIAAQLGFEDVSYFIRLFRRHLGITPHHYRL